MAIPAIRHDHSVPLGHRAAFDGRSSRFTRSVALLAAAFTASLESVFGAMSRQPSPLTRGRWGRWLVSQIAMWGFLIYPISDLTRRGLSAPAAVGAGVAVAVFALAWLATMWLALATTTPFRLIAPWLGTATVVGVPLAFGIGTLGFVGVFIYLSIAAAVSLPMPATLPAIGTATGAAALLLAAMASPVSADTVLGQLSLVFWLGIMMWFYRRMSLKNLQLRRAREELARLAVTEERLRFARDLHDLLGHSLSTISLKAQLARRLAAADPLVAAEIADIETITRHALIEVREAVTGYRTTTLADELDTAHTTLGAAGIKTPVQLTGTPLPARADALLAWVLREAVTNTLRHSHARTCTVSLSGHHGVAVLTVADDGVGAGEDPVHGNGLTGLGERLTAAGGFLDTGPGPDGGFTLTARVPLAETDSAIEPDEHPTMVASVPTSMPTSRS